MRGKERGKTTSSQAPAGAVETSLSLRLGAGSAEFDAKRLVLIVILGEKENLKVLTVRKEGNQDLTYTYIHIRT